ncbi:hypothetical protein K439DRAFT_1230811, partial [Ramaria rubella]
VSLPLHLRSTLEPLVCSLPSDLRARLSSYLTESHSEISYFLLSDISKWARTDEAQAKLQARHLDISDYTMISLLAGTITSPSSKFPPYSPPRGAEEAAKRAASDRKAITAIMNALLSIGGAWYAAWWASSRTGWRDEWRVLFALMIAFVVAISEGVLYAIWESRKNRPKSKRTIVKARGGT